jgi:hypothetical protein
MRISFIYFIISFLNFIALFRKRPYWKYFINVEEEGAILEKRVTQESYPEFGPSYGFITVTETENNHLNFLPEA